jgi:16S rRNA (guanine966-N2)-methyltransferase
VRIISGTYKGRRIQAPKNLPVRPTTDMSKEALFNVLNNHFDFGGLKVLDLFAGTGAISYEFGSRGAAQVVCVDADFGCIKFIKQVAAEFEFPISAIKSDVFSFLQKSNMRYDIIFADPPYNLAQKDFERIAATVFERNLLNEEGMMVIEHSKYTKMEKLAYFSFQKAYGGSFFSFFEFAVEEMPESEEGQEEE